MSFHAGAIASAWPATRTGSIGNAPRSRYGGWLPSSQHHRGRFHGVAVAGVFAPVRCRCRRLPASTVDGAPLRAIVRTLANHLYLCEAPATHARNRFHKS